MTFNTLKFTKLLAVAWICVFGVLSGAHASDYTPLVQRGTSDYKTKFNPSSNLLSIEAGEVTIPSVVGATYETKWRIFLPPGTKAFQATLYTYASAPEAKVLMRFGNPPVGTLAGVTAQTASSVNITTVVQQLIANNGGVELPFFAPASAGALKLSSRSNEINQSVLTRVGGWVYINALQLPGNRIYELNTSVTVDEACYRAWFATATFDSAGNPVEGGGQSCTGSIGPTPTPTPTPSDLTGIKLSQNKVFKGSTNVIDVRPVPSTANVSDCRFRSDGGFLAIDTQGRISLNQAANSAPRGQSVPIVCERLGKSPLVDTLQLVETLEDEAVPLTAISLSAPTLNVGDNTTVTIIPVPANAILPAGCKAFDASGTLTNLVIINDNTTVSLSAAALSRSTSVDLKLTCGSASTDLRLNVQPSFTETVDANGNLVVELQMPAKTTDLGSRVNIFVAARIPSYGYFGDSWVFKTGLGDWVVLLSGITRESSVVFKSEGALGASTFLRVPIGFPKADLNSFGIELHWGYRVQPDGEFVNLGKFWPHN